MQNILDQKKEDARATIAAAHSELAHLEQQEARASRTTGIEKWIGNSFDSSSGLTPEFAQFAADYKRELKKNIGTSYTLAAFNCGHFYLSGFIKNEATGKLAYFSTSDVRGPHDDWYTNILVRTAEHIKDYSGGRNNFASWELFPQAVASLTA